MIKALVDKLKRQSSSGKFIPEVDGLRFVAIIAVILYHLNGFLIKKTHRPKDPNFLAEILDKGYFGVPLFFTISGFIIAFPFIQSYRDKTPFPCLKKYFLRRLSRLEPPFIINILVATLFLVLIKKNQLTEIWPNLIATLTYSHSLFFQKPSTINVVAWSLEVELQFYLLAPFSLYGIFKLKAPLTRQLILASLIIFLSLVTSNRSLYLTIIYHINYFLIGFLLCDIYINRWNKQPSPSWIYDLSGCLAWLSLPLIIESSYSKWAPLLVFIAYASVFKGLFLKKLFSVPCFYLIGGMCYTIYLWHFYFLSFVGNLTLKMFNFGHGSYYMEIILLAVIVIPFIVFCSAIFFLLFEKPFMNPAWPNQFKHWIRKK